MREDDYYYRYFDMRMQQFEILERIMPLAASLSWSYEQAGMIAEVIENVGNSIRPESTGLISLRQLQEMREIFGKCHFQRHVKNLKCGRSLFNLFMKWNNIYSLKVGLKGRIT